MAAHFVLPNIPINTRALSFGPRLSLFSEVGYYELGTVGNLTSFIECFHSLGQHICKFIGTKESVYIRKEFNSTGLVWDTNMAAVTLFWDTNMAARDAM